MPGTTRERLRALALGTLEATAPGRRFLQWYHDRRNERRRTIHAEIVAAETLAILDCHVNDVPLRAPAGLLAMHRKCLQPKRGRPRNYYVEAAHVNAMRAQLRPGDTAMDIGASGGIVSAALVRDVGDAGHVIAFEPARRARELLTTMVSANGFANVVAERFAVADRPGTTEFAEYPFVPDHEVAWRPEASAISSANIGGDVERYEVEMTTIDAYLADHPDVAPPRVVKIDVEGFEAHVLRGAAATLEDARPFLSIDIHNRVDGEGTTETEVRGLLEPLGYRFERREHVLLADAA